MENFPEEFLYSESHEYVSVDGNVATIGITDYAAEQLGDIVYVELPKVGSLYTVGDSFGVIESVKSVSDLYSPITGKILEVNEALQDHPEMITESPYERGWIVKIEIDDKSELENLMKAEDYASFVSTLK
ncbi:MAG: glycine cleavage system protein GcvH [Candidatus Sericytochromatia bacterium]|nr:MAG: glycine cleavage system protein GcvH [Candidatus Sericytochromatia bacterium]